MSEVSVLIFEVGIIIGILAVWFTLWTARRR